MQDLFVVIETGGRSTVYPRVHYVYEDDSFDAIHDATHQDAEDLSIVVDLENNQVANVRSLSAGYQAVRASISAQTLDREPSRVLSITCTSAHEGTDIPNLEGTYESQAERARRLFDQIQRRNAELRGLVG